jgi:hypothetical protein
MPFSPFAILSSLIRLIAIISFFPYRVYQPCPSPAAFYQAYDANNLPTLRKLAKNLTDCNDTSREEYRYLTARRLYDAAVVGKTKETIRAEDYNEVIAVYPSLWAAQTDLGDLSMNANNYKQGLRHYDNAIVNIKSSNSEPPKITEDKNNISNKDILTLIAKAKNARLLASLSGEYIEPIRRRNGEKGMHSFKVRGVI